MEEQIPIPDEGGVTTPSTAPVTFVLDRSSPEAVLATIRNAISTDVLDTLKHLCDPQGLSDNPCRTLCEIATEDMSDIDKFKTWFTTAEVTGPATYSGDTATLPILLDPAVQARVVDLGMIMRDKEWYILRFTWK